MSPWCVRGACNCGKRGQRPGAGHRLVHRPGRETLNFVQVTGQLLLVGIVHRHPALEHRLNTKPKPFPRVWASVEELHDHKNAARDA